MTPIDPRLGRFLTLADAAEALVEHYEVDQVPAFEAALQYLEANLDLRPQFGEALLAILDRPSTDGEFFMYCLKALRWPELEDDVRSRVDDASARKDIRARDFYASLLDCVINAERGWPAYGRFATGD